MILKSLLNEILRKELEKKLKTENWDYVHKLGIIQNSIYGVDIQPIAVEISKLRFFLSLIVDEKIDDDKPNRGVVPLPNLEFKFVAANSLIGLPHTMQFSQMELFEARDYIKSLRQLRDDYFASYGEDKRKIEQDFRQIQQKMFEYASKEMVTHKKTLETQTLKLSEWNPFSDEASSWFDPEWMFGVKEGFDVAIANPPYGLLFTSDEKILLRKLFPETQFKIDSYSLFILKAINLLKNNGTCSYIIPNTFLDNYFEEKVRYKLLKELSINEICDLSDKIFESAVVHSMILSFQNMSNEKYDIKISIDNQLYGRRELVPNQYFLQQDKCLINIRNYSASELIEKLKTNSVPLEKLLDIRQAIKTGDDNKYILNMPKKKNCKPILRGKDVQKWQKKFPNLYVDYGQHLACPRDVTIFEQPKILIREAGSEITATFDDENYYIMSSLYNGILIDKKYSLKYLLSLLNSKLFQYLMNKLTFEKTKGAFTKARIFHYYKLPIKILSQKEQVPFITLVDQILSAKQKGPDADTSALERQIDKMVYELYDLTPEEIVIVEGSR